MFTTFEDLFGSALAHYGSGNLHRAARDFARAIEAAPDQVSAYVNQGMVLRSLLQPEASVGVLLRGLDVAPRCPECHMNLALSYADLDLFPQALRHMTLANTLSNDYFARHNMAGLYNRMGDPEQALFWYDKALEVAPEDRETRTYRALTLLALGRFEAAWPEYEERLSKRSGTLRGPEWAGEPIGRRHIVVHAEQGFGDTIQCVRYIPWLAERFGTVTVVPQFELVRLLRESFADLANVEVAINVPHSYDCHVWLSSLMGIFRAGIARIPDNPYIRAPSTVEWRERFEHLPGVRVGFVWAGSTHDQQADRYRSIQFDEMLAALDVPGISLVSLQVGVATAASDRVFDAAPFIDDWHDTAAAVEALDLIISVDTAMAHLAGAMGKEVWLLNQYQSCWRWGRSEARTDWYRCLRIIRQPKLFDWPSALLEARKGLFALVPPV